MKVNELQIGDWVSCLGDPVRVVSLSIKDDELIGIMSPLKTIETFKEEDVYPVPLTAEILINNEFQQDIVGSGLIYHITGAENLYVLVNYRHNGECRNVEISNGPYNLSRPIKYVHELQHALRIAGLNVMAKNFEV